MEKMRQAVIPVLSLCPLKEKSLKITVTAPNRKEKTASFIIGVQARDLKMVKM